MAKQAIDTLPGPAPDALLGAQSAINPVPLDAIERAGATRFGCRVSSLVMRLEDGRVVRLELPAGPPPATGKDWSKTKPGKAILRVLADEKRGLKGETIAKLADYAFNGSFREVLKGLVDMGEIKPDAGENGYMLTGQE